MSGRNDGTRSRRLAVLVSLTIGALGCTPPDIDTELTAFATHAETANTALKSVAVPRAEGELVRARAKHLEGGRVPVTTSPECDELRDRVPTADSSQCRVITLPSVDLSGAVWTEALRFSQSLEAYLGALRAFVASKGPDGASAALSRLVTASGGFAGEQGRSNAAQISASSVPFGVLSGRLLEARKRRVLLQVVRDVDRALGAGLQNIYPALDDLYPEVEQSYQALLNARDRLGRPGATPRDIARVERRMQVYLAAERASPALGLLNMRKAHASLLQALQRGAALDDIAAFFADVEALKTAVKG